MEEYRSLTLEEVAALQRQGCEAEDWSTVYVAEDFTPEAVRDVRFYGETRLGAFERRVELEEGFSLPSGVRHATLRDVSVGDNCLIENVSGYISRYDIGDDCVIMGVGRMSCAPDATFGQGNAIAVLREGGDANVTLFPGLSPQMAALMVRFPEDRELRGRLRRMALRRVAQGKPERGRVGHRSKIVNTQEITNTLIGEDAEVSGAARLAECTVMSAPEASAYVGHGVILDNSLVQAGASVVDGAQVRDSLVGEACHVGKGASLESTLLFANSHVDHGETCAAFCGPFTVSHHKSSLLIGGMYSFYNAGSATNYSNHAYKMGPIHWGSLARGCKTASGAHLSWPAEIGAFSVCLGEIRSHPSVADMPFSYLFGEGDATYLVPGRNLCTVGTYRDVGKWPRRDMRPRGGGVGTIDFDWLSPPVAAACARGKRALETLLREQGDGQESYRYRGCVIRGDALRRGVQYYDMALRLFLGRALERERVELPRGVVGTGEWTDLAGMPLPAEELERVVEDIRRGELDSVEDVEGRLRLAYGRYQEYRWAFAYKTALDLYGLETLTDEDARRLRQDCARAQAEWRDAVRRDAEREFRLGDVAEDTLSAFLSQV